MKKQRLIVSLALIIGLFLTACGGGDNGPPVTMEKQDTSAFSIELPQDWHSDSLDMFGITILIASSADIAAESFMEAGDPTEMFREAPGVLVMSVPQEMAEEGGDLGFSAEELRDLPNEEPGVEITTQGDVTVDGVKGYQLAGKGKFETMDGDNIGVHITVLERDAGPLIVMGFTPDQDIDKNLDIFKYVAGSVTFK